MRIVIIGGGVIGCATAVHLLRAEPTLDVTTVEPDPTYALAATPRASGGIRQLFSLPENIALSQYTLEIIGSWPEFAGPDAPDLGWRQAGYLFIAGKGRPAEVLAANLELQVRHGVPARWLEPTDIAERFPGMTVEDLGGAVLSTSDGWLDPSALLAGLLGAARKLGATVLRDRALGFTVDGSIVRSVELAGGRLTADVFVNAAGCWAPPLAAGVGMPVPVEPMLRLEHHVHGPDAPAELPFVKDPSGLAVRLVTGGLSASVVDMNEPGGFDAAVDHGYFDRVVWPALVHRFPGLDRLRLRATTTGFYDQNRLDGNMILGNRPGTADNLYLACGFSGHGVMHALGVGRALTELIRFGQYRTINLDRLGYQRIVDNQPYAESGIR
jgi:glycine/D-amino acid oxidase-like deaminating enzyme